MYNWSVDLKKLRKHKEKLAIFKLEQAINSILQIFWSVTGKWNALNAKMLIFKEKLKQCEQSLFENAHPWTTCRPKMDVFQIISPR